MWDIGGTFTSSPSTGWLPCALTEHAFSPALSSLADAQDSGKAPCLMLAWPGGSASFWSAPHGSRSCREEGNKHEEHPNGTLLSILRAAASACQALILWLLKGARPEDGPVELSPSRRGSALPCPRAMALAGGAPALAFRFPSCVRVLSCCACLLWSGKKNGMTRRKAKTTWSS